MSDEVSLNYLRQLVLDQKLQIEELNKKVVAVQKQAEAAENYSRQDCLIFRGKLDIRPNLSLRDEMMRLIHFHTGVQFPAWCVNTAHWLGNGHSVIVRFNNKAVREEIYRNRVPKDHQKRGLFIHESLTPTKMELVSRCSKLRRDGKISTYYTQGGSVFVKGSRDRPSVMISPEMSETDIMLRLEKQPASFSQAAARPRLAAQSAGASGPVGRPHVAGMDPVVSSPSVQSPAAPALDGVGTAAEAVVGPKGSGAVKCPQGNEQVRQQQDGEETEGVSEGAAAPEEMVSETGIVAQHACNGETQVSDMPLIQKGDSQRSVKQAGSVSNTKQVGSHGKRCESRDGKHRQPQNDTSFGSSDSDEVCEIRRTEKDGGKGDGTESTQLTTQSSNSPSHTGQRKTRKRNQVRNKK